MRRVDSHKPVFTDLMKAAAVGRQSEVEYLLTQPETLLTLFATDRAGGTPWSGPGRRSLMDALLSSKRPCLEKCA